MNTLEPLTIGMFARLSRLSPKALRLYDELGLLPPARVDPDTGYRWYHPNQLAQARQVALLRRLDMPLARIRTILGQSAADQATALVAYWAEQERDIAAKRELVDFLVRQLTGKDPTMYQVHVRDLPARTLLCTTENLTADQIPGFATPLFAHFGGPTVAKPEGIAGAPFLRYHGELDEDSDAPVEFCCPVADAEIDAVAARYPDMTVRTEPAGREAFLDVPKKAMRTAIAFESLHQWLVSHGEQAEWLPRQIFLCDPRTAEDDDPIYQLTVPLR